MATPVISVANLVVGEKDEFATFLIMLSAPSAVTVNYNTANGTAVANADYVAVSGSLTFAAGQTMQTVEVPIVAGSTVPSKGDFFFNLFDAGGATIGNTQALATIIANTGPTGTPVMAISDPVVDAAAGQVTFAVTLSQPSTSTVTVNYTTAAGSDTANDFVPLSGTLAFAPGETAQTVTVLLAHPTSAEPEESFNLVLSGATGATLPNPVGTAVIGPANQPTVATPVISAGNVTVRETDGYAEFVVQLSAPGLKPVTVNYGTSAGTAAANTGYIQVSGSLSFAPGETVQTIRVPVIDGTTTDTEENFFLNLSSPTNATIAPSSVKVTATILDNGSNPTPPTISGTVAGQAVTDQTTITPFSTVTIADPNSGQIDTVTVTLSGAANSVLPKLDGGSYDATTGVYTDSGSATAVTTALDGLVFTPTADQAPLGQTITTTFAINVTDVVGESASDSTTSVIATETVAPPPPPTISHITPDSGSNLGNVTMTIDGTQFNANDQVEVIAANGTVLDATTVDWVSSTEGWATFNLQGLAVGTYSAEVGENTSSATLTNALQVNNGPAGQLSVNLVLPSTTSAQGTNTVTVQYANTGDTDIAAPILDLSSTQALFQTSIGSTGTSDIEILGTNAAGPAGILPPGAQESVSYTYKPVDVAPGQNITVSVGSIAAGSTIDWSGLEAALQPPTVDATDWNNVWTDFISLVGTTTTSLDNTLSAAATELSQVGQPTSNLGTLLQFELFQASGAMAGTYLSDATDIPATSSSLSLSLDRYYNGTLLARDATGEFGDGWTSTYDVSAVTDASGNVYIQSPGVLHVFTLQANGTYTAAAGDPATLTVSNGLFQMNDGSGDIEKFLANGKLGSITDANGNVVNPTYNASGVLQQVASVTTGETITFASNAQGLITSATDSDGQMVTYTYNAAGTQLLSATGPDGVTSYTYAAPTGSVQDNALTSITNPDGTQEFFAYNSQGWLASQSGAGGSGLLTYTYNGSGQVTVTDASGDPTTLLYGSTGEVAQTQDALGNITQLQYDSAGDLTKVVSPGGSTSGYSYNALGDLTGSTDPLGGTISASYAPGTQNLTDFTNQLGSQIHYTYNAAGDVTGIVYQDGSGDTYQYNTAGLLTSSTDADGNAINYSYNSADELTKEAFADGTSNIYTYDASGNLLTATAQDGTTETYTYNSANQLTSVTDATGQVESYTYNADGQLATRTEPDGSMTRYSYNANGQLAELTDGSGNLLDKYTYDPAGQLIQTVTGNGASTTYLYDADGRTTQILNLNADGSVASYEDYTYNANSQVVAENTSDGAWAYTYDAQGELTGVVFQSTNAAIQNQNISYTYDAAGNRVSQTVNGVTTAYTTNALNEYTTVGGTTYTYDAKATPKDYRIA